MEREDFEKLLQKLPEHLRPLVTFSYYCGVRIGEAVQIRWDQSDLKQALVRLEGEQAKTGEARVIPLPEVLVKTFKSVKIKEGSVFDDRALRDDWSEAVVAAELPGDSRSAPFGDSKFDCGGRTGERCDINFGAQNARCFRPLSHRRHCGGFERNEAGREKLPER